jgi:hypothetical protein
MRYEAAATCLSWIPPTAVEGPLGLPFALRIAHYDQPPPDHGPDVDALIAGDAIRFANQIRAWIEVGDDGRITGYGSSGGGRIGSTSLRLASRSLTFPGVPLPDLSPPPEVHPDRVRFTQTAGGHTGSPAPRRVPRPPYWRLTAPMAWSTISLTLHADGSSEAALTAASPFPRHYLYDASGALTHKSAVIDFARWAHQSGLEASPWGGGGGAVPVIDPTGIVERRLADGLLRGGAFTQHALARDHLLIELPIADDQVHLLLDGIMVMEVDGEPVFEVGPGSIYSATLGTTYLEEHVTVRARTAARFAVLPAARLGEAALAELTGEQFARLDRRT